MEMQLYVLVDTVTNTFYQHKTKKVKASKLGDFSTAEIYRTKKSATAWLNYIMNMIEADAEMFDYYVKKQGVVKYAHDNYLEHKDFFEARKALDNYGIEIICLEIGLTNAKSIQ